APTSGAAPANARRHHPVSTALAPCWSCTSNRSARRKPAPCCVRLAATAPAGPGAAGATANGRTSIFPSIVPPATSRPPSQWRGPGNNALHDLQVVVDAAHARHLPGGLDGPLCRGPAVDHPPQGNNPIQGADLQARIAQARYGRHRTDDIGIDDGILIVHHHHTAFRALVATLVVALVRYRHVAG